MRWIFLLLAFGLATPAFADERNCRQALFSLTPPALRLARVHGPAPAVYDGSKWQPSCPWDIVKCSSKSTFAPDGFVVASNFRKGLACIVEIAPEGHEGRDGWVEARHISLEPQLAAPSVSDWIGTWGRYDDKIVISRAGARLKVKGYALWHGAYNTHDGEVEGTAVPRANHLLVSQDPEDSDACQLSLSLVGKYLVAADNDRCGGQNVTFRGIYSRVKPAPAHAR